MNHKNNIAFGSFIVPEWKAVYSISRNKCFWFCSQRYHNKEPLWDSILFVFSENKRFEQKRARVVKRCCKARSISLELLLIYDYKYISQARKSINLRGTGSRMNTKLIKSCEITWITEAQWIEPIVKKRDSVIKIGVRVPGISNQTFFF